MGSDRSVEAAAERDLSTTARERLLAGLPVDERRLRLAGISTMLLEGGSGPPMVLLHGPGEFAAKWRWVIPDLCESHRVVAPDLPGHGASGAAPGPLDVDRVLAWLGELIEHTCSSPPVLVGQIVGGAIAARFAAGKGDRLAGLVLADSLGLAPFRPAPEFGQALTEFYQQPSEARFDALWRRCAFDLGALQRRLDAHWEDLKTYALELAREPDRLAAVDALMGQLGVPAIPPEELERITVPTRLIWGRHDLATPLEVAEAASARYGWPLEVIENAADDPPVEQPEAFLASLRKALDGSPTASRVSTSESRASMGGAG